MVIALRDHTDTGGVGLTAEHGVAFTGVIGGSLPSRSWARMVELAGADSCGDAGRSRVSNPCRGHCSSRPNLDEMPDMRVMESIR